MVALCSNKINYANNRLYMKYILLGAAIAFAMYLGDKYIL